MLSFEKDVSLRERKQAKTKVLLAQEFLKSLKDARYENISIKSICESAEVSEGTFYNYFPQKMDIFNYIIGLYATKNILETNGVVSREKPIEWIRAFFENIAGVMVDLGNLPSEIFSVVIRERFHPQWIDISRLEFLYMFPEFENEKNIQETPSYEDSLEEAVRKAFEQGIMKDAVSAEDVVMSLKLLLGGISIIRSLHGDDMEVADIVKSQLSIILWGVMK